MNFSNEERYAAGFVLNKLYTLRCFAKRKNIRHGRHTQLANMQKGYPPDMRGLINPVCQKMNDKLVLIFKSTGEDHICALNEDDAIEVGLQICNYYRKKSGLPQLNRFFKEMQEKESRDPVKKDYRKPSEKERRNREYLEKVKKWMQDQSS